MGEVDKVRNQFKVLVNEMEKDLIHWEEKLNGTADPRKLDKYLPDFIKDIYKYHNKMYETACGCDESSMKDMQHAYRDRLNKYWAQGGISRRCIDLPRGYHGDFATMQMMYRKDYEGDTNLGKCLHRFITDDPSSTSVRRRREHLREKIKAVCANKAGVVLSVASGPAAEIVDCLKEGVRFKTIALLDQDQEAILEAEKAIREVMPDDTELVLLNISIRDYIRNGDEDLENFGPYDFIYSAGLFDYLPDHAAKKLTSDLLVQLAETGMLDIGNFTDFPIGFFSDYAFGWKLILRGPEEIKNFLPEGVDYSMCRVGDQTFVSMKKA